jgi:alcohol dehydrogenase
VAEVLCEKRIRDQETAWKELLNLLETWTEELQLPRLSKYGVKQEGLDKVVASSRGSSMKTNPIILTDEEIKNIVAARL